MLLKVHKLLTNGAFSGGLRELKGTDAECLIRSGAFPRDEPVGSI